MSRLQFEPQKNSKIKLTVKSRTKILTKEFAFALSIAFFVHFLAFTLFHIDLGLFSTTREYPTAVVQAGDISLTSHDQEKPLIVPSFLIVKPQNAPEYPSMDVLPLATTFDLSGLEIATLNMPALSHFYLSGNAFEIEPSPLKSTCPCRAKLAFKSYQDKIFWLDWIESTGDLKLDYRIQEALKKASLKTQDQTHGIIEVEFLT